MTPINLSELTHVPSTQSTALRLATSLSTPYSLAPPSHNPRLRSAFQQKFRLNLELNEVGSLSAASAALSTWDIVAVRASTEATFHALCSHDCIDIIQIDCGNKLPFYLKRPSINLALQNGLMFELEYGPGIRDQSSRRYLFAAASALTRVCPAKAIVLSSGCESASGRELRSPFDVINIMRLMGFNEREARDSISFNAERALWHGETRRTNKGAVRMSKIFATKNNATGAPSPSSSSSSSSPSSSSASQHTKKNNEERPSKRAKRMQDELVSTSAVSQAASPNAGELDHSIHDSEEGVSAEDEQE